MSLDLPLVQEKIKFNFQNPQWLYQAFCHKSFHKEHPEIPHNEKLEFLGDAVLDFVVSDILMETFKGDNEGSLSRKRASVVNEDRLCYLAKSRSLDHFILIGEREANHRLHENSRIVASVFESVVGAIYKDSGFDAVYRWLSEIFSPVIDEAFSEHDFESDYKTRFQEWVQENHKLTPRYQVISQDGPDHARVFEVEVFVGDTSWGKATGQSKKTAAQNAAQIALEQIPKAREQE